MENQTGPPRIILAPITSSVTLAPSEMAGRFHAQATSFTSTAPVDLPRAKDE